MKLDFFARRENYIDHLAPIWNAFPPARRGVFYVDESRIDYAVRELGNQQIAVFNGNSPAGDGPILTCAYGDMIRAARNERRKIISMEHGTGHTFGTASYPDGAGKRSLVHLALMPNEYTAQKARAVRDTHCGVIGTPKTDEFVMIHPPAIPEKPVIAIAFHWGGSHAVPPESGNAWEHYKDILPELAKQYKVIGHGHPIAIKEFIPVYERAGIEVVKDFREVIQRADVYINDLSSTLHEFILTGKPVIVLNAPWFRRDINWGIRFWDYSDVGINVEEPAGLFPAIERTLDEYRTIHYFERVKAVKDLYPYLGESTNRAVEVLTAYLIGLEVPNAVQPA